MSDVSAVVERLSGWWPVESFIKELREEGVTLEDDALDTLRSYEVVVIDEGDDIVRES